MKLAKLSIFAAALLSAFGAAAQERPTVIQGATLIDGTGRPAVADSTIVYQQGRIRAVGRRGQVAVPANAEIIQATGKTVLPGLVDMHLHLREWRVPLYLKYGVTTTGDIHNDTMWIVGQKALLESGYMQGPHLFVSGARIEGPNGPKNVDSTGKTIDDPNMVKTPEEARAYVRYLHAMHCDFVKVDFSVTDEQLSAIIDEAWKFHMPVLGHINNVDTTMDLGGKEAEHMVSVWRAQVIRQGKPLPKPGKDEQQKLLEAVDMGKLGPLINKMVEQNMISDIAMYDWVKPVIWPAVKAEVAKLVNDPSFNFYDPGERKRLISDPGPQREGYDKTMGFLKQFAAANGKFLISTDGSENTDIIPGLGLHIVMQAVAGMGIPTSKIIQSVTLWPAEAMGVDKDYGSIEQGKNADFVIVEGDPLKDITAARNIKTVIKDGKVMDTKLDPNWKNPQPRPSGVMAP